MKITFGSDPELMLVDNQRGGKIVSSIPVLKKDKKDPIMLGNGVKLYADNVLAEIAHPPVNTSEEAVDKFRSIFAMVKEFLGSRHSLLAQSAHVYGLDELGPKKDDNWAWATGCNPNLDAYAERENPKVNFNDGLRTGSFHIHLGHEKLKTMFEKADAVKLMDVYIGCASILFDRDNTSPLRRQYYGRAGEFRATPYGVEWRVQLRPADT
jgi:hypothetical protein